MSAVQKSLKALAAQVLTGTSEVKQPSGTPWNSLCLEEEKRNADTPECSSIPEACSAFQGPDCGTPEHDEGRRLSHLLAERGIVHVWSQVLGEAVVWAADNARIPPETIEVVYREAELQRLAGLQPEMVRAVHRTKKALDGEVVE